MLDDPDGTKQSDLAKRLGKKSGHISQYKKRLMLSGVIAENKSGDLVLCIPGFREYVTDIARES